MGYNDRFLHPGKGKSNVIDKNGNLKNSYAMPDYYSVNQIKEWVKKDFGSKIVRDANSKNASLKEGEYLIAFRVAFYWVQSIKSTWVYDKKTGKKSTNRGYTRKYKQMIFIFMKKDPNTGIWWQKSGRTDIKKLGKINPDSNKYWNGAYFYNSKTLYLIVKAKFWSK